VDTNCTDFEEYDDDPIGTHMAALLNSEELPELLYRRFEAANRLKWSLSSSNGGSGDDEDGNGLFLLLSSRNWNRIRYFILTYI